MRRGSAGLTPARKDRTCLREQHQQPFQARQACFKWCQIAQHTQWAVCQFVGDKFESGCYGEGTSVFSTMHPFVITVDVIEVSTPINKQRSRRIQNCSSPQIPGAVAKLVDLWIGGDNGTFNNLIEEPAADLIFQYSTEACQP